jgi:hypothetical protein
MPAKKKPAAKPAAKRGRGRPSNPEAISHDQPVQFRAASDKKTRWEETAGAAGRSFSDWARDGLDAWVDLTKRAAELEADPRALLVEALEDHLRVRGAVAELRRMKTLSTADERLLRILSPVEWAKRSAS